jgi:hypothetical protein
MTVVTTTAADTDTDHRAGTSFEDDGRWCTPCGCGKRFTSDSPSKAQARQRKHAEEEREKTGKVAPRPHTPVARAKECGCGCGQALAPKAGGLFRSGHDARFKSMLTVAHASGEQLPHPLSKEPMSAMAIAVWLDERRGGGSFWQDKVAAGHKPAPERKPRVPRQATLSAEERGEARAARLMDALASRRPAAGEVGMVTLRSGSQHGARVVSRKDHQSLVVRFLDGPSCNQEVVVLDHRFTKKK